MGFDWFLRDFDKVLRRVLMFDKNIGVVIDKNTGTNTKTIVV
jgi:hypothetical protein